MALDNVRYDAFISYRHCELDSFISENLHKKLESYKMPSIVAKKLDPKKQKIERVFRDEAELPLSGNLSDPITAALDNSEFLIVICTPRLRESQWCLKEIETFVAAHDREHVLLVLAEGEPDESFPEILLHEEKTVKDADGNDISVTVEREPLAADCRGDNNRERLKKLDNVVLKLCAAIFGLNYDDLRQRHHERQVRRRIAIASAAFAIVTLFAITCLFFMIRISRQKKEIQDKYAGAMADASEALLSDGLLKDSVYAVRSVLPDKSSSEYNTDAYYAMCEALAPYEVSNCYYPGESFAVPRDIYSMEISSDADLMLINAEGYCEVINLVSHDPVFRAECESACIDKDRVIYINDNGQVLLANISDKEAKIILEDAVGMYSDNKNGTVLLFTYDGMAVYKDGSITSETSLEEWWSQDGEDVESVTFSEDGKYAAFALSSLDGIHAGIIDIESGDCEIPVNAEDMDNPVAATDGNVLYLYYEEGDYITGESAKIIAKDMGSDETTAERTLSGDGYYDLIPRSFGLLAVSDRMTYMLDENLEDIDVITGYMDSMCEFSYDYGFVLLDRTGKMFTADIFSTDETAFELYGHDPGTFLSHVAYDEQNDRFFIQPADIGRVSVYTRHGMSELLSDTGSAAKITYPENMPDTDQLEDIKDISYSASAISDDGKYMVVSSIDGSLYVYDRTTGKKIKSLYDTGVLMMQTLFCHLDKADVYILDNKVFDSDFNMISSIPDGQIEAKGDDCIYLRSRYEDGKFYRIDIQSYEDMINRADEFLDGYEPDDEIKSRYSIN